MILKNKDVALVLISHEKSENVLRMRERWEALTEPGHTLVTYGGTIAEFDRISGNKVFIADKRLRTQDHQREFQSYSEVLRASFGFLSERKWSWLFFAEYDLIPLSSDFFPALIAEAEEQDADVMGAGAYRLDNTLHSHHTAHAAAPGWSEWLRSISRREDPSVVLSCLGCGQLWRREAFEAVIAAGEPVKSYLEVLLPTVAHHLGFRVRSWKSHSQFVVSESLPHTNLDVYLAEGAKAVHPLKAHWSK